MRRHHILFLLCLGGLAVAHPGAAHAQPPMPTRGVDHRYLALNLDGGGLWQTGSEPSWAALGRVGAGIGWFNGARVRSVQVETGLHSGGQWILGAGVELASVQTGVAAGAAVLRNLSSDAFGARLELGLSLLRFQGAAFADSEGTKQVGAFLRIPVGLIAAVLLQKP